MVPGAAPVAAGGPATLEEVLEMYEVPSWKDELRRRLAELRERAMVSVREPAKAAACAPASGAGRSAGRRNSPAKQRKRWQR